MKTWERDSTWRTVATRDCLAICGVYERPNGFVAYDGSRESPVYQSESWARRWLMKRLARMDVPTQRFRR